MSNTFNWRVVSANTLKAYTLAAKDFETVTGLPVDRADVVALSRWHQSMQGRGLAVNTIRQRLSAVCVISGAHYALPERQKAECSMLSADQVRSMMAVVSDKDERLLLVRLLTVGSMARTVRTVANDTFRAHFMGAQDETLSSKEVSRKLRRYARKAGITTDVNMRTWCKTGRKLMSEQGIADLVSLLSGPTDAPAPWKPLHGIGRRSHTVQA